MARDYTNELKWQASEEQKKRRAARNKVRRQAIREGKVKKGDGKQIDHKDFNPLNSSKSNLRVIDGNTNMARKPPHLRRKK